jgi:hypothetical protein
MGVRMTWLWLFAHMGIKETGNDYGDFGLAIVEAHHIGSRSNRVLAIQWDICINGVPT